MKIGNFRIPTNRLYPNLILDVKKIYEKFSGEEIEVQYVAQLLGHTSHRSGTFLQKAADSRFYGLIEGKGKIKVSELGKKITYGHEAERMEALEKAIRNIPLWGIFLDKFGTSIKEDNFWIDLAKITGVERVDAQLNAKWILNAYMEDVRHLKSTEKPAESLNSIPQTIETFDKNEKNMINQAVEPMVEPIVKSEDIEEIKFGDIYIRMPRRNSKSILMAKKLLELYEEGITKETSTAS
ncbi:MAG: hypothetical protein WCE94_03735 [Candidatus Methanoperedens sp.]